MAVRKWRESFIDLVAGMPFEYNPEVGPNIVYVLNRCPGPIYLSIHASISTNLYEDRVPAGLYGALIRPFAIEQCFFLSPDGGQAFVIEVAVDDPVFAFNQMIRGELDVTDRAARAVGKVGIQVAGADVGAANPVPADVTDRAARALGKVGLQVAGTDVSAANPVPAEPTAQAATKVTAAAAGDVTVKSTAGRVFAVVVSVAATLKDGTNEVWILPANTPVTFFRPLAHNTSIVIKFSAAGDAYIQYE